jgi:leucyl-tRNA synthetase
MGFDAFGLPAEQYAIETGTHPEVTTLKNIENMRKQLKACGLSYDWSREISTTDPSYYKWTQWIFLQLFHAWYNEQTDKAEPIDTLKKAYQADQFRFDGQTRLAQSEAGYAQASPWLSMTDAQKEQALAADRLAYMDDVVVNWCPGLGTVLANEEVTIDGRSERGNHPVFKRPLKQWMLRITKYADRLEKDLDHVHWPMAVKQMQTHWIGKSQGASVCFNQHQHPEAPAIEVFTTRPDTLFGVTFLVLAPEHPMVDELTTSEQKQAVAQYKKQALAKSEVDRQAETRDKKGVFTGSYAINPASDEKIPVWIADYVLMGYGTGAIMAVPAHDQRDFEFAQAYNIDIRAVVEPTPKFLKQHTITLLEYLEDPGYLSEAFTEKTQCTQSESPAINLNNLPCDRASKKMIDFLERHQMGQGKTQFKLRDWLFSRQRYWGEPFPILHGPNGEIRAVDADDLPVVLPELSDFKPTASDDMDQAPAPSLDRAPEEWKKVVIDGVEYTRELNTMPQWAGSCWYYLRFTDPNNQDVFASPEAQAYWMGQKGVDLYVGGVEHAVLHLLYARFWHKVLYDLGHVACIEPFGTLFNQGYIQAYSYQDARGMYVDATAVEEDDQGNFTHQGKPVTRNLGKMGKSLKNAIGPEEVIETFGCDTFRLYEMYLGPIEQSKTWDTDAIIGIHRFLQRVWRNFVTDQAEKTNQKDCPLEPKIAGILARTIAHVTESMNGMKFNTAIAQLIQLNNLFVSMDCIPEQAAQAFIKMLSPLAPHMAEEIWQMWGHTTSIAHAPWPTYDPKALEKDEIELVVQVNGKRRASLQVSPNIAKDDAQALALEQENVQKHLEGMSIVKCIFVPKRLVNFVVKPQ